ncbi:MAG TPA: MFS transporter [Candidatus Limnocylindria bacterium]|nr:MFS transporter [Candidatus Limnocylindria bacterium]
MRLGSLTRQQLVGLAVVMAGSFVAALDQSIVATVMPTVIGELGGIDRYALVFSGYLLVSTVSTPILGRLADVFGRTPVFIGGMAIFVVGSVGAGLAADMLQLVVARAVQGFGAGALLPVGMTIAGDLFDVRGRARVQPLFSSVWIVAALVGPAIGGILTQAFSWRWAFLVNLPIGVAAIVLLLIVFRERVEPHGERIDWVGATLLTLASGGLLLALNGIIPIAALATAALCAPLFLSVERRSRSPLIDLDLVRDAAVGPGIALNAVVGGMTFAMSTYLPPFIQGVQGHTPVEAGAIVTVTSLGWSSGALSMGLILVRLGPRLCALAGTLCWAVGGAILVLLGPTSPLQLAALAAAILGLGMGLTIFPILVSAQSAVGWAQRGVVTGLVNFARSMGAAIGVAALGTLLFWSMGADATAVQALLDPASRRELDPAHAAALGGALAGGLHAVYFTMVLVSVLGALLARRLPRAFAEKDAGSAVGA